MSSNSRSCGKWLYRIIKSLLCHCFVFRCGFEPLFSFCFAVQTAEEQSREECMRGAPALRCVLSVVSPCPLCVHCSLLPTVPLPLCSALRFALVALLS